MAKGLFTQGMCVLLKTPMSIQEINRRLAMFREVGRQQSYEDDAAPLTVVYEFRPEVDGHLLVTPSSATWPDAMGEPDENPEAFVAWSLGQFGPLTYPGCLARALGESTLDASTHRLAVGHAAHVRLLISYVVGNDEADAEDSAEDLPMVPDQYDAMQELNTLTRAVTALMESPLAICYFNPGGEVLLDADRLREGLNRAWAAEQPPLEVWMQMRHLPCGDEESAAGWSVIDTVGQGQLDLPDLEAAFCDADYSHEDVRRFLQEITADLMQRETEEALFLDGEQRPGPGEVTWIAIECSDSINAPPRPTIRWIPQDGTEVPESVLDDGDQDEDPDADEWLEESEDAIDSADPEWGDDELDEPF